MVLVLQPVADPGFPRRGQNLLFDKVFVENCMKMKEIGTSVPLPQMQR